MFIEKEEMYLLNKKCWIVVPIILLFTIYIMISEYLIDNKSHQKCKKIAVQILFVLIKAKLKIQLKSKTMINPPSAN